LNWVYKEKVALRWTYQVIEEILALAQGHEAEKRIPLSFLHAKKDMIMTNDE